MKVIIAGPRFISNQELVDAVIESSGFCITEVVSGRARGVDRCGENWAERHGIPIKLFPADWERYNKGAGPIRNELMAKYADALIVILHKDAIGSKDMLKRAKAHCLKTHVFWDQRVHANTTNQPALPD